MAAKQQAGRMLFSLSLVVLLLLVQTTAPHGQAHGGAIDCGASCSHRCQQSGRPKMCLRACNTCCQRCGCVPPGNSGNEDACPCYRDMITRDGKHKCPRSDPMIHPHTECGPINPWIHQLANKTC